MNIDENELKQLYSEGRRDFHGCDLSDADLTEIDLSFANLSGANLSNANLNYSNLSYTNLISAQLRGASIIEANLKWSDIIYADLKDTNLEGADLDWANLRGANLTNAYLKKVKNIERADITDAIGLEKPEHIIRKIEEKNIYQLNLFFPDDRVISDYKKQKNEPKYQESCNKKPPAALWPNISIHTKTQGILAQIGQKLGHKVWIAGNDHSKEYIFGEHRLRDNTCEDSRLGKLKELTMEEFPVGGLDKKVEKISKLIDVIWLDTQFKIVALFEIECTTAIHSGLLRMGDFVANVKLNTLTFIDPNFPIYIVIPKKRKMHLQT
ncbi:MULTISPECIES: pentapeptide repeat-containing protein [unclassified Microcoleus]|uniref:pentapeptide repeat-containing protein n=1 Tax=unclassified Microcoleus TaxID=2642155 RepID=UPI002FD796F5